MENTPINIAIVDDELLIVELLSKILKEDPDFEVIFTANSGEDLLEKFDQPELSVDVVLIDLRMKDLNGVDTILQLKKTHPEQKVVILSSHYQLAFSGYLFQSGANAFLSKNGEVDLMKRVIKSVHEHGFYFSQEQLETLQHQMAGNLPQPPIDKHVGITDREMDVLKLICQQLTAKEIGERLFISKRTAEAHKSSLLLKTGAKNTTGLVIYALQQGIVNPDELIV